MIACVLNALKALILTFLGLVKKILWCCWWKKENQDKEEESQFVPLLSVDVSNNRLSEAQEGPMGAADWENWSEGPHEIVCQQSSTPKPNSVSDHIQAYRQALERNRRKKAAETAQKTTDNTNGGGGGVVEPPEVDDLFADLAPKSIKQKKLYVGPKTPSQTSSRLSLQPAAPEADPILARGGELEDWNAVSTSGWNAEDEDLTDAIREQKKRLKNS